MHRLVATAVSAIVVFTTACGGDDPSATATAPEGDTVAAADQDSAQDTAGIRLVSVDMAADLQAEPPEDLFVLDVRTPEEFAEGHLEGATMIDFYGADFEDRIADLDRDRPYLLYCRSGNRSGQTRQLMEQLGFTDVADVDGGVIAWTSAGHDLVTG